MTTHNLNDSQLILKGTQVKPFFLKLFLIFASFHKYKGKVKTDSWPHKNGNYAGHFATHIIHFYFTFTTTIGAE